jgi:hypothetical protein
LPRSVAAGEGWEDAGLCALFHASNRSTAFTDKHVGNGATLDTGLLVLSKLGRIALRWSRPLAGTPKTVTISREADGG